jgi:hypothetical protein
MPHINAVQGISINFKKFKIAIREEKKLSEKQE